MYILKDHDHEKALKILSQVQEIAQKATCTRSRCGSIIIKDDEVIGQGFNTPPAGLDSQRRCSNSKDSYHSKVTDKTCCVHAEQRAIMDALRNHPDKIVGSRLFFVRLGENGQAKTSRKPYCTICSKMALDTGVKEFVLWQTEGFCAYDTAEYNSLSYEYTK
jgi:deoxycytidylate deaminase